ARGRYPHADRMDRRPAVVHDRSGHRRRVEDDSVCRAPRAGSFTDDSAHRIRGCAGRRCKLLATVLAPHPAADPPGSVVGAWLPRARRAALVRPDLRAAAKQPGPDVDALLCPPAGNRVPGPGLWLGRFNLAVLRARTEHRADHDRRPLPTYAAGGFAMSVRRRNALLWLASAPILLFSVGPLYYAFVTSVGRGTQALEPHLFPASWSLENYVAVFREQPFGWSILNSLLIAGAAVGVALLLGLIAAYALGRLQFGGRSVLMASFLCVSMFPQIAMLSGLFELICALGLYNTRVGLTLCYLILTCPFTVWLLTTYMREIPREIEEAAIIDGASPWVIASRVFAPVMAPALVSTGLLAFV